MLHYPLSIFFSNLLSLSIYLTLYYHIQLIIILASLFDTILPYLLTSLFLLSPSSSPFSSVTSSFISSLSLSLLVVCMFHISSLLHLPPLLLPPYSACLLSYSFIHSISHSIESIHSHLLSIIYYIYIILLSYLMLSVSHSSVFVFSSLLLSIDHSTFISQNVSSLLSHNLLFFSRREFLFSSPSIFESSLIHSFFLSLNYK